MTQQAGPTNGVDNILTEWFPYVSMLTCEVSRSKSEPQPYTI